MGQKKWRDKYRKYFIILDVQTKVAHKVHSANVAFILKGYEALHLGFTGNLDSPFEEMNPSVSSKHSESQRSKSQKSWIARYILSEYIYIYLQELFYRNLASYTIFSRP